MAQWQQTSDSIMIGSESNEENTINMIVFKGLGLCFLLGGAWLAYISFEGTLLNPFFLIPAFLMLFGYGIILVTIKQNFSLFTMVDRDKGLLIHGTKPIPPQYDPSHLSDDYIRIPLADLDSIQLIATKEERADSEFDDTFFSTLRTFYELHFQCKDQGFFWVETFLEKEELHQRALQLHEYLGLAIVDLVDGQLQRDPIPNDKLVDAPRHDVERIPGPLVAKEREDRLQLQFNPGSNQDKKYLPISLLAFAMVLGIPAFLFIYALRSPNNFANQLSAGLLCLLVYGGFGIMLFMGLTRKTIELDSSRLLLKQHRPFGLFCKTIELPIEAIVAFQVHFTNAGNHWMTLQLDTSIKALTTLEIMTTNAGHRQDNNIIGLHDSSDPNQLVGIWTVTARQARSRGVPLALYKAKALLTEKLHNAKKPTD